MRKTHGAAGSSLPNPMRGCYTHRSANGGHLAQLVEQLTLNQRVVGSNPTVPTTNPLKSLNKMPYCTAPSGTGWKFVRTVSAKCLRATATDTGHEKAAPGCPRAA